ncbi:MAG TPA: hypothetical protein VMH86_08310 [Rhizomicrobium sp.]|nr:hypothetical protein [Rhizomicrobium sp.]
MQIGTSSLLIAAQHALKAQPAASPRTQPPAFEPLPLKPAAASGGPPRAASAEAAAQPRRPGSMLDIRV